MDNFQIDVTAEGTASLRRAIEIAFAHNAPGGKIESYAVRTLPTSDYSTLPKGVENREALILRWSATCADNGAVALPFKLDAEGAADFVSRWLAERDMGREPDHDGDNGRGWRMFTGAWGHIGSDHYAVCAVIPAWAMYGK